VSPLGVVLRTPSALFLLVTSLIGRLPTAMAALAIVQLVRLQGGDFVAAGVMTALYIVAGAVGQPLLSRWVDRSGRTVVLLVGAVASSASFVAVALFSVSLPVAAAVGATLAGFFAPPLEPSLRSLWPRLVPEGKPLKAAFSLDAGAQEIMFILGPLLTVVGIAAFGATGNVLFAAALGLVGTVAFALNRVSRTPDARDISVHGTSSPFRDRRFRLIVAFTFGVGLPVGVLTIVATVFEETHGLAGFSGWALAVNALGALTGATIVAVRPLTVAPERALAACGALLALGYVPLGFDLPWPLWLVAAGISGLMLPPTLAQVFEAVSTVSAASGLNEANAWVVSAMSIGIATGTLGAGAVSGWDPGLGLPVSIAAAAALTGALALAVLPTRMSSP
jgi:MFS family permease